MAASMEKRSAASRAASKGSSMAAKRVTMTVEQMAGLAVAAKVSHWADRTDRSWVASLVASTVVLSVERLVAMTDKSSAVNWVERRAVSKVVPMA